MIDEAGVGHSGPELWRASVAERVAQRAADRDRAIEAWTFGALILTMLFILIGANPYEHTSVLDYDTDTAALSPVNRYIWIGLFVLTAPVLWLRRGQLGALIGVAWPVLALFVWFAVTVALAIDPEAAQRRYLLTCLNLAIAAAVVIGLPEGQRFHHAIAISCAIVVGIDFLSWIFLPRLSMTTLGLAGIHPQKNTLGGVALFAAFACGAYALGRVRKREQVVWWGFAAGAGVLLLASRSKTSLGILAGVLVLAPPLLALLRRPPRVVFAAALAGVALLATLTLSWMAWAYSHGDSPLAIISGVTFDKRTDVWQFIWMHVEAHPRHGVGFGSFWDINPAIQPTRQSDVWFSHGEASTNEGHNGYLDLLVTTGFPGLIGGSIILFRWAKAGLGGLGPNSPSGADEDRAQRAFAIFLGGFVLIFFAHNWLESSYFTPNAMFGVIILFIGLALDFSTARYVPRRRLSVVPAKPQSATGLTRG